MSKPMLLLHGMTQDEASKALTRTRPRHLRPNALVCAQGEPGDCLFLIRSGQVKRYLMADDGRQIVLDQLGPGEHFGEIALITRGPHPASVAAIEDTHLLALSREAFEQLLASHPVILRNLTVTLAQRLAALTEAYGSIALEECFTRVVRVLEGCAARDGDRRVTPALTQRDIAARIGCSREMVSRVLAKLRTRGYLGNDGRRMLILRPLPRRC